MNNFFDNTRIIEVLWKRKLHLLIVFAVAAVLAVIFSSPFFLKPKFKSTARIYPTNIFSFSEESRSEQMLEIIHSQDIKLKMIDAFNLPEVYKIRRNSPSFLSFILDKYDKNISANKTEYETVEIKVLDENPQRACTMCDSLIDFYNQKVSVMHRLKQMEMVRITKETLDRKNHELDTVLVNINKLRESSGIYDFPLQAGEVTRGYMEALANGRGSTPDAQKIKALYDNLSEKGAETRKQEVKFNKLIHMVDSLSNLYETHLAEANKKITYCHVVQHPLPADKKSYPVRWLILFFSTVSAVFLASLVFLILDYKKENS
jgi:uncharacterized protein involved in exopolysaccharide biosynthesis